MEDDNVLNKIAADILMRAVDLDNKKRYTEAMVCYQEGIQVLLNRTKELTDADKKQEYRIKIENYMRRAEKLKDIIETKKQNGSYHEQLLIENNSTGHSYESVFGRFLDNSIEWIAIDDPYIRSYHQCQNILRFCELVVKSCKSIKNIRLLTVQDSNDQIARLKLLQDDLQNRYKIEFQIEFSDTLHDRQIRLSNGWIIKIGRGLDYFRSPVGKLSIGMYDLHLRNCWETTVDIFHQKNVRQINGDCK